MQARSVLDGVRTTILVTGDYDLTMIFSLREINREIYACLLKVSRQKCGGVRTTVLATGDYDVEQVDGHGAKF